MKKLLLVIFIASCGKIDFTTRHGMIFFVDSAIDLPQQTAEHVTDQFIDAYALASGFDPADIAAQLVNTQVVIHDYLYPCNNSLTKLCAGLYYHESKILYIAFPPDTTLCKSAYWHELVHLETCELEALCYTGTGGNDDLIMKRMMELRKSCTNK